MVALNNYFITEYYAVIVGLLVVVSHSWEPGSFHGKTTIIKTKSQLLIIHIFSIMVLRELFVEG